MDRNNNAHGGSNTSVKTDASSRTLDIDGMKGDECVQKVKSALQGVQGLTSPRVEVGSCTYSCSDPAKSKTAISAIKAAGYEAREGHGKHNGTELEAGKSQAQGGASRDRAGAETGAAARKGEASDKDCSNPGAEKGANRSGTNSRN